VHALNQAQLLSETMLFVISVPGIVPIGMDTLYPFAYYDWDPALETSSIICDYVARLTLRASHFLTHTKTRFRRFIAYFRPHSAELKVLCQASQAAAVQLEIVPTPQTVRRLRERDRATWRFRGLKAQECLLDLRNLISEETSIKR